MNKITPYEASIVVVISSILLWFLVIVDTIALVQLYKNVSQSIYLEQRLVQLDQQMIDAKIK